MNCTRCGCEHTIKSGFNWNGKQRFECKGCGCHFIEQHNPPDTRQPEVIRIYRSGVSICQTARLTGVSHTTARRWIARYALNTFG